MLRYAIVFSAVGLAGLVVAATQGSLFWLLLWPAVLFLAIGFAYGRAAHRFWGKRDTGETSVLRACVFGPYWLLNWMLWHGQRWTTGKHACDLIAEHKDGRGDIWLGRWPFVGDLPAGTSPVVDCTAVCPVRPGVIGDRTYRVLPMLDGGVPQDEARFQQIVDEVANHEGTTYTHCASGHGRSALVAAAVLLARREAVDAADALNQIRRQRPKIRLNRIQQAFLSRLAGMQRPSEPGTEANYKEC